jgi:hypothetical protein
MRIYSNPDGEIIYVVRVPEDVAQAPERFHEVLEFDGDTNPEFRSLVYDHLHLIRLREGAVTVAGQPWALNGAGMHYRSALRADAAAEEVRQLPTWADIEPAAAAEHVRMGVLEGKDRATINAEIDAAYASATTVALMRTTTIAMVKVLAGAILDLRGLVALLVRIMCHLRDIAVER